jgi:hypothetical protein
MRYEAYVGSVDVTVKKIKTNGNTKRCNSTSIEGEHQVCRRDDGDYWQQLDATILLHTVLRRKWKRPGPFQSLLPRL